MSRLGAVEAGAVQDVTIRVGADSQVQFSLDHGRTVGALRLVHLTWGKNMPMICHDFRLMAILENEVKQKHKWFLERDNIYAGRAYTRSLGRLENLHRSFNIFPLNLSHISAYQFGEQLAIAHARHITTRTANRGRSSHERTGKDWVAYNAIRLPLFPIPILGDNRPVKQHRPKLYPSHVSQIQPSKIAFRPASPVAALTCYPKANRQLSSGEDDCNSNCHGGSGMHAQRGPRYYDHCGYGSGSDLISGTSVSHGAYGSHTKGGYGSLAERGYGSNSGSDSDGNASNDVSNSNCESGPRGGSSSYVKGIYDSHDGSHGDGDYRSRVDGTSYGSHDEDSSGYGLHADPTHMGGDYDPRVDVTYGSHDEDSSGYSLYADRTHMGGDYESRVDVTYDSRDEDNSGYGLHTIGYDHSADDHNCNEFGQQFRNIYNLPDDADDDEDNSSYGLHTIGYDHSADDHGCNEFGQQFCHIYNLSDDDDDDDYIRHFKSMNAFCVTVEYNSPFDNELPSIPPTSSALKEVKSTWFMTRPPLPNLAGHLTRHLRMI